MRISPCPKARGVKGRTKSRIRRSDDKKRRADFPKGETGHAVLKCFINRLIGDFIFDPRREFRDGKTDLFHGIPVAYGHGLVV